MIDLFSAKYNWNITLINWIGQKKISTKPYVFLNWQSVTFIKLLNKSVIFLFYIIIFLSV